MTPPELVIVFKLDVQYTTLPVAVTSVVNTTVTEVQLKRTVDILVGRALILTTYPVVTTVFPTLSVHVTTITLTPALNHVNVIVHQVVHVAKFQLTVIVDRVPVVSFPVPVIVAVLQVN